MSIYINVKFVQYLQYIGDHVTAGIHRLTNKKLSAKCGKPSLRQIAFIVQKDTTNTVELNYPPSYPAVNTESYKKS